jgi:hypothetical protein
MRKWKWVLVNGCEGLSYQISTTPEFCNVYHAGPNASMCPGIIVNNKHTGVPMTSLYIGITFGALFIEHPASNTQRGKIRLLINWKGYGRIKCGLRHYTRILLVNPKISQSGKCAFRRRFKQDTSVIKIKN